MTRPGPLRLLRAARGVGATGRAGAVAAAFGRGVAARRGHPGGPGTGRGGGPEEAPAAQPAGYAALFSVQLAIVGRAADTGEPGRSDGVSGRASGASEVRGGDGGRSLNI